MMLSIIAAMDKNRLIGKNNQLPWHLPADLKHFKALTMGKPILMGRKTFESIGKPLPGRQNIVLTRNKDYQAEHIDIVYSLEEALQLIQTQNEIMLIGGADLFKQALPMAQRLYLTLVHAEFSGDTYFPEWNHEDWEIIKQEEHPPDDKNPYALTFLNLNKHSIRNATTSE